MSSNPFFKNLEDNELIRKATQSGTSLDEYVKAQQPLDIPGPINFDEIIKNSINPESEIPSPLLASNGRVPTSISSVQPSLDSKSLPRDRRLLPYNQKHR